MREIKFKCRVKEDNRIHKVAGLDFTNRMVTVYILKSQGRFTVPMRFRFSFDEVDLLQFTTLLDKNGKEGYYDDLVRCPAVKNPDVVLRVSWNEKQGIGELLGESNGVPINLPISLLKMSEVIGNIYEHPHLLQKGGSDGEG